MGLISPTLPTQGSPRGSEEVDVLNVLTALVNLVNGSLDSANLAVNAVGTAEVADGAITADKLLTALRQQLGVTDSSSVRRGKSIIATEESRTNTAYGTMTTPDQVSSVVLPTDGFICLIYQAQFKNSVSGAGDAAIFLGANQVKVAQNGTAAPVVAEESSGNTSANTYRPLYSALPTGLSTVSDATAYSGDVTTGQIIGEDNASPTGSPVYIFAAAGTYDVSVRFKSSSGSVTVKERKLWVWTLGF